MPAGADVLSYSIVVPIYGDGALAEALACEIDRVFQNESYELIFVEDGSGRPGSVESLVDLQRKMPDKVRTIIFSRNFGQHIALTCGFEHARGEYVAMMNVDQEDPPSELPKLFSELRARGLDHITGLRVSREKSFFRDLTSVGFHRFLNFLTDSDIPIDCTTMRAMNRKFLTAFLSFRERTRYIPGLEAWLGFNRGYLPIRQQPRKIGKSTYNFKRRLKMATETVLSFSDFPLRMAAAIGSLLAAFGFATCVLLVLEQLFFRNFLPGYVPTIALLCLFCGVQILCTGLVGLYVGRVMREVQHRPLYVIKDRYGFEGVQP